MKLFSGNRYCKLHTGSSAAIKRPYWRVGKKRKGEGEGEGEGDCKNKHRFGPKMVSETTLLIASKFKPLFTPPPMNCSCSCYSCHIWCTQVTATARIECLGAYPPQNFFLVAPILEVRSPFKIFCGLALYTVCLYLRYRQINDDTNRTTQNLLILSVNAFINENFAG